MPVVKTSKEGNVTTEIIDMTEGKGHLSTDEILAKTGTQGGTYTEVGPDGKTYTYSVEVEEVRIFDHFTLSRTLFCRLVQILLTQLIEHFQKHCHFTNDIDDAFIGSVANT